MRSTTPQISYDLISLKGGLDQVTPTLSQQPGNVRDAVNYECSITGGYTRIAGYERYDGRTSPSSATYLPMTVTISGAIAVGNTVTGVTSGATGYVIVSGSGTIVVTKVTGAFTVGETLNVAAAPQGTYTASGASYAVTPLLDATWTGLAADAYRADIAAVPGSGPIRGVAYFGNIVYAWRDNVGATALALYKSSGSGWTSVTLGFQLSFTAGLVAGIVDGDTVTGLTSGATGVVLRVVVQSGTFAAGTAAGRLIFASITGTFSAAENLRVAGTNRATCSGAQAATTLLPGGSIETVIANFGGGVSSTKLYGVDGVNKGFEFDGTAYVPIVTGMTVDAPDHLIAHKLHLFFAFGSSVQFSGIGAPYVWTPVLGAGEIAVNGDVTNFLQLPGDQTTGAVAIYSADSTAILYGSSSLDFDLRQYNEGIGAKAHSAQNVSASYVFDTHGITDLRASQEYGNFATTSLSINIRTFIQQRRNLLTASGVNREKSQYRAFFSDGYGLYMTSINGKFAGVMPVLFPNPVTCMCEGETPDGAETSFFGSTDGKIYRLDSGTSFDGASISSYFVLTWNSTKSPRTIKRYRRASMEVTGSAYAEIAFSYEMGYGSTEVEQMPAMSYDTNITASYWDSFTWDNFYWDGRTMAPSEVEMLGSAENISIRVACDSAIFQPFTINSMIVHYSPRRGIR